MVCDKEALPGRSEALAIEADHFVNGRPLKGPYPDGAQKVLFGMGCFWGAERLLWQTKGVWVTAVGYSGGLTPNATYEEVCTGLTGHNEVVMVVFEPHEISFPSLLEVFWEAHNPTQGMRQGNDVGTQYRSGIYVFSDEHYQIAKLSRTRYQSVLAAQRFSAITTEIEHAGEFYFAETYHQQYLAKNPGGYCSMSGIGVCYPRED